MRYRIYVTLLCLFAITAIWAQNTITDLKISVIIFDNGSVSVEEERHVQVTDDGTESYITFNDMGDIELSALRVHDEQSDEDYVFEEEWDVDRSRQQKARRCGYHYTGEGVEICWGLGDTGDRVYTVSYKLSNLVKAYNDFDGFCHSFYESVGTAPEKAELIIRHERDSLTRDNTAIWTFGYHGMKGFDDGYCYATSDDMDPGDSFIVLMQFPKGFLSPEVTVSDSFSETVKRTALTGSDYNLADAGLDDGQSSQVGGIQRFSSSGGGNDDYEMSDTAATIIAAVLVFGGLFYFFFIMPLISKMKRKKHAKKMVQYMFDTEDFNEVQYYRSLPLNGNLLKSGALLGTINTYLDHGKFKKMNLNYRLQNLYEAFVLRMLYKKQIELVPNPDKGKSDKLFLINEPVEPQSDKDLSDIIDQKHQLSDNKWVENEALNSIQVQQYLTLYKGLINDLGIEYSLQLLLYNAAGEDHLLQPSELKQYINEHTLDCRPLATILRLLSSFVINDMGVLRPDVQQVVGFYRYLADFSLVGERYIEETSLWKEYLVFASVFGIARQVRRDMKKIAPDVTRLDDLLPSDNIFKQIAPLSTTLDDSMRTAYAYMTPDEKDRVERERRRSSGGSGSSSYSGGGGHSGGGGSGFR